MSEEANYSGEDMQEAAAPTADESTNSHTAHPERESNEERVPLSALQAERAQRQKLAEDFQMLKDHVSLMQAQNQPKAEPPKSVFDGLDRNDIPTWGDIEKVFNDRERQYQSKLTEIEMMQRHPDYAETINKYLPDVIKQNPRLRNTLESTQDYELAYTLAKNSDAYRSAHKKAQKNADAERMVQNSQQAGSLSAMGTTSPINTAKRYRDMTDDDFRKLVNKNMGYVN